MSDTCYFCIYPIVPKLSSFGQLNVCFEHFHQRNKPEYNFNRNDYQSKVSKRFYNFINSEEFNIKTPQHKISIDLFAKLIEKKYSLIITNHFQPVTEIVVSFVKNIIVSASSDKIMVWDIKTLRNICIIESGLKKYLNKIPSPKKLLITEISDYIIYTDVDDYIKKYNLKDPEDSQKGTDVGETINAIHLTKKEKNLIAISETSILIYTFPGILLIKSLKLNSINSSIPEKIPLLVQVFDSKIFIVPKCTSSQIFFSFTKKFESFNQVSLNSKIYPTVIQLSHSKEIFVLGSISGEIFYLNQLNFVETNSEFSTLTGHFNRVNLITFAPDDQRFATAGLDEFILVWDSKSMIALKRVGINGTGCISGCFYDDFNLIVGYSGFYMERFNVECDGQGFWMPGHADSVSCITLSYSNNFIVTGGNDCAIFAWNITEKSFNYLLKAHECPLVGISISNDDKLIASSSCDLSVKVWNRDGFELLHNFDDNHLRVIKIDFSAHSDYIATKSSDNSFKIYELAQDKRIQCLYFKDLKKYKFKRYSKSKKYLILSSQKCVYEVFKSKGNY